MDFGDGTPRVTGKGPVPAVPHTYLNKNEQAITLDASLKVTPDGEQERVLTSQVEVNPAGTIVVLDGTPVPAKLRRGSEGVVDLTVRNPNAAALVVCSLCRYPQKQRQP